MEKRYIYFLSALIVVSLCLALTLLYFGMSASLPWVPTGRLAILVHPSPALETDVQLGLGIDDVRLHRDDGVVERATVLTRRVLFDTKNDSFALLIDTDVPEGNYTGFSFVLKSPELRNAWQQDTPPDHIALVSDAVYMDVSYHVTRDSLTAIMLGFETQRTLFEEDDTIVFLPVIQVETRNETSLLIGEDGTASVSGGVIKASATYGMDWDGRVRYNFRPKARVPQTTTDTGTLIDRTETSDTEKEAEEPSMYDVEIDTGTTTQPSATSTDIKTEEENEEDALETITP